MIDSNVIQRLKRTNITADAEKTKSRMNEVWKAATNANKRKIEDLAGVKRQTLYRIYNTGAISAKLAAATAQTLAVNPYYLTGEEDDNTEYTEALLERFLADKGYEKLLTELASKPKRKYQRRALREDGLDAVSEESSPPIQLVQSIPCGDADFTADADIGGDDLVILLRAAIIRAKAGDVSAFEALNDIKKRLLM